MAAAVALECGGGGGEFCFASAASAFRDLSINRFSEVLPRRAVLLEF